MIDEKIRGKRVLSIDFGLKRIGLAICDEYHIAIRPLTTLLNDTAFILNLTQIIESERVGAVVIGVPVRNDNKNVELIAKIDELAERINKEFGLEVFRHDEFMSSKKASQTLVEIGRKKSKRAVKGELDKIAAAIILQEFILENE